VASTIQPTSATQNPRANLNGDFGSNYKLTYVDGYGTSYASNMDNGSSFSLAYASTVSANPMLSIMNFMDYSATDKQKNAIIRYGSSTSGVGIYFLRWESTSAITSITINANNSITFSAGTTFSLYGVAA
jgi:hypothetical protein